MAEICVIYLSEDAAIVERLVVLLRKHWSVWWAGDITHGDWEEVIRAEIPKSLAIVPVFSSHAKGGRKKILKDEMELAETAFIATGASLFPGSHIGAGAEVRINAVVQVNTLVQPGGVVPIGWVAVGNPAHIFSADKHDEIWAIQKGLDFGGTVYGVSNDVSMRDLMHGQSIYYGAHVDDVVIG